MARLGIRHFPSLLLLAGGVGVGVSFPQTPKDKYLVCSFSGLLFIWSQPQTY